MRAFCYRVCFKQQALQRKKRKRVHELGYGSVYRFHSHRWFVLRDHRSRQRPYPCVWDPQACLARPKHNWSIHCPSDVISHPLQSVFNSLKGCHLMSRLNWNVFMLSCMGQIRIILWTIPEKFSPNSTCYLEKRKRERKERMYFPGAFGCLAWTGTFSCFLIGVKCMKVNAFGYVITILWTSPERLSSTVHLLWQRKGLGSRSVPQASGMGQNQHNLSESDTPINTHDTAFQPALAYRQTLPNISHFVQSHV